MASMGREESSVPVSPVKAVKIRIEEARVMRIRMSLSATYITSAHCQTGGLCDYVHLGEQAEDNKYALRNQVMIAHIIPAIP